MLAFQNWVQSKMPVGSSTGDPPHQCPPGASLSCPGGPWHHLLLRLWMGLAQSSGASCPVQDGCQDAVGQAGPQCLAISLAPAGIFLECDEAEQEAVAGRTGRQADRRAGSGGGGSTENSSSWCPVLGPTRGATGEAILGGMPRTLPFGLHPCPTWAQLITSHRLPWGPGKDKDLTRESYQPWWVCT